MRRLGMLLASMTVGGQLSRTRARRGLVSQRQRRQAERSVRMSAVGTLRWMRRRELSLKDAAHRLGLKPDTLGRWASRWRRDRMQLKARGRPAQRPAPELRNEILATMWFTGPHVGLPALQDEFPEVARAELIELQRRYRLAYGRKTSWLMYTLRWMKPGRVWTTDFTKAPAPIEGCYERLLVVRDLGSGRNLLALPAEAESAEVVLGALEALFIRHGPPLVLKSDNGGAFISAQVKALLAAHGVLHLLSPVRTPQYNGSVEAGIGSLRTRAHYESARNDRPGQWTCDDIEAARLQANFTAHLDGPLSLTPEQAWAARQTTTESEREAFRQVYDQYRHEERRTRTERSDSVLGRAAEASIDRAAIPRALVECGYLLFRRRRISPPIIRRRVAKIS